MSKQSLIQLITILFLSSQVIYASSVLLNEYNAVAQTEYLKNGGYDVNLGTVAGNGNSWVEFIVVEDVSLVQAQLKITHSNCADYIASFPDIAPFSNLKKGTIITVSHFATDLSYNPSAENPDWSININYNDMNTLEGEFIVSSSKAKISILSQAGATIAPITGEGIFGRGIDNKEVFKLKAEPIPTLSPSNQDIYSDDISNISTFGEANQWSGDNGIVIQNLSNLRGTPTLPPPADNIKVVLNEYNAVAQTEYLKNDGYDINLGIIVGNGNSWVEFVVVEDINLEQAKLKITNSGYADYIATFPDIAPFSNLKKGTIITVSYFATDLSYNPSAENPDWSININYSDMNTIEGEFVVSDNKAKISIIAQTGAIIAPITGEGIFGRGIDNKEVFKLRSNPNINLSPNNADIYGDDNYQQIISTFGQANQWINNGEIIYQNINTLRGITSENRIKILLNEYNAVAQTEYLKYDGYDVSLGIVLGNGDSWVEFVVIEDIDLANAKVKITNTFYDDYIASFPNIEPLTNLKKGTIITISHMPTDLSYNPNLDNSDWNININCNDMNTIEGIFTVTNNEAKISIISQTGAVISPVTGEGVFGSGIDNKEVFKLKQEPAITVSPDNADIYGDDNYMQIISTFGLPNKWINTSKDIIEQNFDRIRNLPQDNYTLNSSLILNEYNAVSSDEFLKDNGYDIYFNRVAGNGGSWIEFVVTKDYLNLQGTTLEIKQDGEDIFEANFPELLQLAFLRKGTIITISSLPTDVSYAPFSQNGSDWTININHLDMIYLNGEFKLTDKQVATSIISYNKKEILLETSGESIFGSIVDNKEIFKLKKEPTVDTLPNDVNYGDDNDGMTISTFGSPNIWADGNQKFNIRVNPDLNEVDGIVISDIAGLDGLKDGESLLYVPQNNSLWITDDDSYRVFEMDLTTKEIKSVFDDKILGSFTDGNISDTCYNDGNRDGICDIESVAYDKDNDTLYIFAGNAPGTPAIFQLTRESINDSFTLNQYRNLGNSEYPAVQFIDSQFIVSIWDELFVYNFETNQIDENNPIYTIYSGKILGLAYDNGILWVTTSNKELLKIDWTNKQRLAKYDMKANGVFDPRGIEVIDNKLYILEGINASGDEIIAPIGHALKNAIHIYETP